MIKGLIRVVTFVLLVATSIGLQAQVIQESQPDRIRWDMISSEGTITNINKDTREVTIMGPKGNLNTIKASEHIKRFDEIKVDDKIEFEYWTYIKAEFREPTLAERAEPLQLVAETAKAPDGVDPSTMVGAIAKAIVTIEVLNRPFMMATVKGPGGNFMSIPVNDPKILEKVHIGQEFILTYAEAIAISLKKVE